MTNNTRLAQLTAFETVLDTFGSDPARWPAESRETFLRLAAADSEARRLLREAKALDDVLAHGAGPPLGDTSALAARIAAAVANTAPGPVRQERQVLEPQAASGMAPSSVAHATGGPGVVIAWPRSGNAARISAQAAAPTSAAPARERMNSFWRTAALLAASLVVGVFVGTSDLMPSDVARLVANATTGTDGSSQALAFLNGEGLLEILEEEFL